MRILVIRLSAMGDVAMSVPVVGALRKQYPEAQIVVLTPAFYSLSSGELRLWSSFLPILRAGIKG